MGFLQIFPSNQFIGLNQKLGVSEGMVRDGLVFLCLDGEL